MRLSSLIASSDSLSLLGHDVDVKGITADSRLVEPGFLFFAIPGTKNDGRKFIEEAIHRGASVIASLPGTISDSEITRIETSNIRAAVSRIASRFFPNQPNTIAAVTGTSGKTSTAQFTRELWHALGHKSASIGTLGYVSSEESNYGSLTTPDAITLHQLLNQSASKGISHLVMEASSHGISLNRLDHVHIKCAGFTNLSRDHLDFHETMENYRDAKIRLFSSLVMPGGTAVLNFDSPQFHLFNHAALAAQLKVISYGKTSCDIKLISAIPQPSGQLLTLSVLGQNREIFLPLIGEFQTWNALCALGLVIASGAPPDHALAALGMVSAVPGRLQLVAKTKLGATIFVDYAHKPDALENVLKALRPHVAAHQGARLGLVFGCGGNRDRGKRPIMGEIAQRFADWVIVTDDNPRHEEPSQIRREILAGCTNGPTLHEIGDRSRAIETGIALLATHDVLVIAGKGHESGQIVGDDVLPFDDTTIARKVLGL